MKCQHIDLPGGGHAIICSDGRTPKCKFCGAKSTKQCDFADSSRLTGTCDAYMCNRCSMPIAHEKDYCPNHAKVAAELYQERAGIKEFEGNMPRAQAEREAWAEIYGVTS